MIKVGVIGARGFAGHHINKFPEVVDPERAFITAVSTAYPPSALDKISSSLRDLCVSAVK